MIAMKSYFFDSNLRLAFCKVEDFCKRNLNLRSEYNVQNVHCDCSGVQLLLA